MRTRYRRAIYVWMAMMLTLSPLQAHGESPTNVEDESVKQHELFDFEASIKHSDIADGTEGFDENDEPGNDSGPHNGIVRSWDTITYPVKMTINPKKADVLEDIKIKLSGTLRNGVTDDRVNARFAIGNKTDMDKREVSFIQEYTIERTGNSVMIPVTIEVQGAKHGVELTPDIQVEVVSVGGEVLDQKVITVFDELPGTTTSAKVNIKPLIGSGLAGLDYPYFPYSKMYEGGSEEVGMHSFSVSWGVDRLDGKTDMRGATFPDSDGEINYHLELSGQVYWDNAPTKKGWQDFNFDGPDTPLWLFDHQPINTVTNKIGKANTLMDGRAYRHQYPRHYTAAKSAMEDYTENTIKRTSYNTVWDSGEWSVSKPKKNSDKVTHAGKNTGYTIGTTFPLRHAYVNDEERYRVYGVNDRVFSTNGFMIDMQNEYRIDGELNPHNYTNNVYYRVTVVLDDYTDPEGNVTRFDKSVGKTITIRNGTGGISAYGTFQRYPSGYTSPKNPWNYSSSVGDASILIGEDVNFTPRLNPTDHLFGGYTAAYRWNTDAFELTKNFAEQAERNIYARGYRNLTFDWVTNDYGHQDVYYGVAKFSDNSFENFTSKNIDDYDWYESYDEARNHGVIGAMKSDVRAPVGGQKGAALNIPLKVRHENIGFGSVTKNGTPVIALINAHAFIDKDRKIMKDVTANRSYGNYSEWDDSGTLQKVQTPVGGGVNFESLGIVPAKTGTTLKAEKDAYYNSEIINWTAKSSIVLPQFGVPSDVDTGVTLRQTLPKGLDYKTGSGRIDGETAEPGIVRNSDGTVDLVWQMLISTRDSTIPTVTFKTTINPFALSGSGVQSSASVKSVIESALDGGPESGRSSTETVTILKVGMVGIYETIDKTLGEKNSEFTVTLSPYTTIEDEMNVTGLTNIPLSGDELGSDYTGAATLKTISVTANRADDDGVTVYLNNQPSYSDEPQNIDVTKDGWYEYESGMDISRAVSLLFVVDGRMTNKDDVQIDLTVKTEGNEFGDTYLNETVINSDTDYRLSPVSNRVRYSIRADLELALERFRIYTDKAESGLITSVRVKQSVFDQPAVEDLPITLAIYNTETGRKVTEKTYKQHELQRENDIRIPGDGLEKATHRNYEVRLEGYDENRVWVRNGEGRIDTDGYTAQEKTLTMDDANADGDVKFTGVVMTERELGKEIAIYRETFAIPLIQEPNVKSGYGFEIKGEISYSNDMMNDIQSRLGVPYAVGAHLEVDNRIIDPSLEPYDESREASIIPMEPTDETTGADVKTAYQLPSFYLEQETGLTYTLQQKENGEMNHPAVDAGHRLFVPVWIEHTGEYDVRFKTDETLGVHRTKVNLLRHVNVEAYMFNHTDSDTPEDDELLIRPMEQDDIPRNW